MSKGVEIILKNPPNSFSRHVLLLPPPPGDTTERRWARRWRVAVARAARERQRGGCARFKGRGARVGSRVGRQAGDEGNGSRQCARWAQRGIKARRARAAGGAQDKPGLSSGLELARNWGTKNDFLLAFSEVKTILLCLGKTQTKKDCSWYRFRDQV
ncbi:hypothetical protein B0H11DRAFT_2204578 [Mycena galericulata]|nr:hypothetical protein B0H11DRAFT_2204578 [Mycena galericulata]